MKRSNDEIIHYKMFNHEKSDVEMDFYMNTESSEIRHQHECWEIILVCGNGIVNIVNGERLELKEREAFIVRPDDTYYTQSLKGKGQQYLSISVRAEVFEEMLKKISSIALTRFNAYPKNTPKIKYSVTTYEKILHLVKLSQGCESADCEERQFLLKEILTHFLFEYEETFHTKGIKGEINYSFSTAMINLFNQTENIGLKLYEVCAQYPCSVEYAIRRFQLEGLDTPNKVFRGIKLNYACLLLKTTNYKILTICEKIGFNNLGYFNKLFLSTYGVTPKEYRNKHRVSNTKNKL